MRLVFLAQLFLLTLLSSVHGQTFSVGIESPATVAGTGATRSFTARATLRLESVPEGLGVQAWSIGLRANGAQITGASVDDTVAADRGVNPEGLREEGFEFTELTSGPDNEGVVSAVVLSFTRPNKLPEDVDNYVLDVELEAPAPASGCETVSLEYAEGLRGTGEPVEVKVILEGDSYRPQSSGSETQVCSFPEAELSSESLSFAPLIVGESNTQNVELRNVGPAPLSVSTVSVEGAAFSLAADYDGSELASGAAIELDVGFSPTEVTDYSGTLQVVSNDPSNPILAIPLDGSGVPRPVPSIEVDPTSVDFGTIFVDRDKMESVLIWNRGDARLEISRLAIVGDSSFTLPGGNSVGPIDPGSSAQVDLLYDPNGLGSVAATLEIDSNDPKLSTVSVDLSGQAIETPVPDIESDPSELDFGTLILDASDSLTVSISNAGNATLNIGSISLDPASSDSFSYSGPESARVVQGFSAELTVDCTARSLGVQVGTLRIESDDPDDPVLEISLRVEGMEEPRPMFRRGDASESGDLDLSDSVLIFGYLFLGNTPPACFDAADTNDDGDIDLADGIYGLNFLFLNGPAIPDPGPIECGVDPTEDAFEECDYSSC